MAEFRILQRRDLDVLCAVEPGLFDGPVDPARALAFLESDLHLMAAAFEEGQIVSFASGTILLHPDKPPGLFINEVGTRDGYTRRGMATEVTKALIAEGRRRGCEGAWLATEPQNAAARSLYVKLGGEEQVLHGFAWDGAFDAD
jgi:aminoglycoside 6'-N-acetyltransferase I